MATITGIPTFKVKLMRDNTVHIILQAKDKETAEKLFNEITNNAKQNKLQINLDIDTTFKAC